MKHLLSCLLLAGLLLPGCATEQGTFTSPPQLFAEATDTPTAGPLLRGGKFKFKGPVTIQVGQGNTSATVGTDKTGQRAQAVSTGANSPVTASQKKGGVPWWVFGLVGVVSIAGWEWISHQGLLGWLPWRARAG